MKFSEGGQYENPPPGSYIARCISLVDLGTQHHQGYQGREGYTSRDVRIGFELPLKLMKGEFDDRMKGRPFGVSIICAMVLSANSRLKKLLSGWRGRAMTRDEIATFNPKSLLGKACRLQLVQNGDYVNIDSIAPLSELENGQKETCPKQVNPSVFFSLEPNEFDSKVFSALGKKTQDKISQSPEFAALTGKDDSPVSPPEGGDEPPPVDEPW